MFRAHRPILRRVHTAVHTTIGSVSVLLWPCALYVVLCFIPYFERMHGTKGLKILLLLLLQIYYYCYYYYTATTTTILVTPILSRSGNFSNGPFQLSFT